MGRATARCNDLGGPHPRYKNEGEGFRGFGDPVVT